MRVFRRHGAVGAVTLAATLVLIAAQPVPAGAVPIDQSYAKLLVKKVEGKNVQKHMVALQAIANANGGTRAAGTSGYDASRDYVAAKLRNAGYNVTLHPINFVEAWVENSPPTLEAEPDRHPPAPASSAQPPGEHQQPALPIDR